MFSINIPLLRRDAVRNVILLDEATDI